MIRKRLYVWKVGLVCLLLVGGGMPMWGQTREIASAIKTDVGMETAYRQLKARFEERDPSLQNDLKTYLEQYPYTTYKDEVHFMSGVLYAEKGKWKNAAKALEQADYKALSRPHQPDYQFYRGYVNLMLQEYERAITYFAILKKGNSGAAGRPHLHGGNPYTQKATYYWGYCQYKLQRYDKALPAFLSLESVSEYQATVPYFIVQSYYAQGDFTEAQARAEEMLVVSGQQSVVRGQGSVVSGQQSVVSGQEGELHRMLGEIYYRKGDYKQAVSHLRAYFEMATTSEEPRPLTPSPQAGRGSEQILSAVPIVRNDIYLLGMAEYQIGAYQEAVTHLKQVKQEKDTISESASLTLGHAYRRLGESGQLPSASAQEQAKMAYQAAIGYGLTPRVSEEALYNYTLCTYEHSSALGESVKAFTAFLKNYPQSQYREQIFTLLGDAFMRSKNYQAALNVLDSIEVAGEYRGDSDSRGSRDSKGYAGLAETKQYLRYQLGVDAFLQGKMEKSRAWMTEVIQGGTVSRPYQESAIDSKVRHGDRTSFGHCETMVRSGDRTSYTTEAYYWRAEAAYRLHDYEACASDIAHYLAQPDVRRSANYASAAYLYGYALFSLRRFDEAGEQFLRYIDQASGQWSVVSGQGSGVSGQWAVGSGQSGNDPTYADALNRMGDCAFNARDFRSAIAYYGQVIDLGAAGSDYATFQKGYAQGLLRKYTDKISTMQTLVARYPKSDYADDGMYEIARAQLQLEDEPAAIETYGQLLKTYPNSNLARKAMLERAMLYGNLHRTDEAIAAYKATIDRYPATDEAYAALDALEALYVETNNIAEYLDYTKQLSKQNMHVTTADDSLSYAAAELQYMQGNYTAAATALSGYLSTYCAGGRYCTTAQQQLADAYYRLMQPADALREYKALAEIAGNPYMEEACMRVAELSYDAADYATALDYFYRLLSQASSTENTDIARLGILRCSYYLGQHRATIDIAGQILADYHTDSNQAPVAAEARYNRAKAYIALEQWGEAIADLQVVAEEVRTANGAEAKYLLAECYFAENELDMAEEEIMSFAQMNTQQQYWLARALILLADINTRRGDTFQAKQYLLSLQANYQPAGDGDDIAERVAGRLREDN
ncbi:MAG: tetratricopeptide repeat protein [Paludibacteraceae bacterium]